MSMTFAPMGLSVIERTRLTCSSIHSSGAPPHAMMPRPPALLTAPARLAFAMRAMAPWMTGTSMPSSSVTRVFMRYALFLSDLQAAPFPGRAALLAKHRAPPGVRERQGGGRKAQGPGAEAPRYFNESMWATSCPTVWMPSG